MVNFRFQRPHYLAARLRGLSALKWFAFVVLTTLVGFGVKATIYDPFRTLVSPPPPSLDSQYLQLIRSASKMNLRLDAMKGVDLRGSGKVSRLMLFTPLTQYGELDQSDAIRIYDVNHGRLHLAFSFRPIGIETWTEKRKHKSALVHRYIRHYSIEILDAGDLDKNGASEIVANFVAEYADGFISRPVVIYWDWKLGKIRLKPLLTSEEDFVAGNSLYVSRRSYEGNALSRNYGQDYRSVYLGRARVVDQHTGRSFRSFSGQYFVTVRNPEPTLVGGFFVEAGPCHLCVSEMQVIGWSLDLERSHSAVPNYETEKPILVKVNGLGDYSEVIRKAWLRR